MQYVKGFVLMIVATFFVVASVFATGPSRVEYRDFFPGVGASMPESFFAAKDSSLMALIDAVQQDSSLGLVVNGTADSLECDDALNVGYAWSRAYAVKNRALSLGLPASCIVSVEGNIVSDTGGYYRAAWVEIQSFPEISNAREVDVLEWKVDLLTLAVKTMVDGSTDTCVTTHTKHLGLFASMSPTATISKLGYGLGVNLKIGDSSIYLDGTATSSFNARNLLLSIKAAYPISSRMTLLVGGSSNVMAEADGSSFEEYLYAFNSGLDMNFGRASLRLIWTPGKHHVDGSDSEMDLNAFTVQFTVSGFSTIF